jgi:sporulation protein YlmC with PRC-barrel domain
MATLAARHRLTRKEGTMNQPTQTQTYSKPRESNRGAVERDETNRLISSEKVDGTAVYNTKGEKIGHIDHLMIGKRSGQVEYAVMSFGGILGMREKYHPLPWDTLDYDTERDGYVVDVDKEQLEKAPSYEEGQQPDYNRDYGETVYGYYGVIY